MSGWLYLIRNRDLYKIGVTKSFDKRMRQLKPDNIVAKLYTSDFLKIERELHKRYKKYRIPQTEYFRLEDYHVKEIKLCIAKLDFPMSIILGIIIKSLLMILLIFFFVFIFISLNINNVNTITVQSLLLMEKISIIFSIYTIFDRSGKFYGFLSELKYRVSRFIVFILLAFIFRLAYMFF